MSSELEKKLSANASDKPAYNPPRIMCISSDLTKNKQLEINACNSGFGSGPVEPEKSEDNNSVSY